MAWGSQRSQLSSKKEKGFNITLLGLVSNLKYIILAYLALSPARHQIPPQPFEHFKKTGYFLPQKAEGNQEFGGKTLKTVFSLHVPVFTSEGLLDSRKYLDRGSPLIF